jgi:cellulose synthase/poly-beta-1,6-N-acetylglucosamine synthase-like glycosyltransferase
MTLGACLKALAQQSIDANSYEVIVVNDGSTDGSADIAAQFRVKLICQDHRGAASARNLGARHALGRVLLFTDADCEPKPDWIEHMLKPLSDPNVAGVKGSYRTRQSSLVARFTQAEYEEKYDRLRRARRIDFVDTHAAAYRHDLFSEHGGFDPGFLLDEDQELSFRLARAGLELRFAPAAVVFHQHPATVRAYAWRKMRLGRWKVLVHMRYPEKAIRDSYTPLTQKAQIVFLPLTIAAVIASICSFLPWPLVLVPALLGLISSLPLTVKARHQGWQVAVLAPVMVVVRAAAQGLGLAWGVIHRPKLEPGLWEDPATRSRITGE